MLEIIAQIVLLISFLGLTFIISRKISVLSQMPVSVGKDSSLAGFLKRINLPLSLNLVLQKIFSGTKSVVAKTESRVSESLKTLKKRNERIMRKDNYWKEIQKSVNKRIKKK